MRGLCVQESGTGWPKMGIASHKAAIFAKAHLCRRASDMLAMCAEPIFSAEMMESQIRVAANA